MTGFDWNLVFYVAEKIESCFEMKQRDNEQSERHLNQSNTWHSKYFYNPYYLNISTPDIQILFLGKFFNGIGVYKEYLTGGGKYTKGK